MSMHMIKGVQVHGKSKSKKQKLTKAKLEKLQVEWRQYNKKMRQNHAHDMQFAEFNDYVDYVHGKYKPKKKKEFKEYVPPSQSHVRDTKEYPSLKTSDTIPDSCAKKESMQYTGDLIVGIGTMHKSNAVPIMRGTKQAEEIAKMRRG